MSELLLAKPTLSADFLDVSVGEAHVVRDNLLNVFNIIPYHLPDVKNMFEYQEPQGYRPLVKLLENKYKSPVIITNGAKNAIGAVCFALKQMGKHTLSLSNPYWCLFPPIIKIHGLDWKESYEGCDSRLLVMPNNPDNNIKSVQEISELELECKEKNIPLVHDAVYYNHIYLPATFQLKQIGDVQVYSASKSFGLSGLRVGWVVCQNPEFYKLIQYYMEAMTVGVSTISQIFLYDLLNRMHGYPTLTEKFEAISFDALTSAKKIIKQVNPEIMEVPDNMESVPGMFGFFKCHKPEVFAQAKINVAWGEPFGAPGYVRMNLAFPEKTMLDIVQRLNSTKESNV